LLFFNLFIFDVDMELFSHVFGFALTMILIVDDF